MKENLIALGGVILVTLFGAPVLAQQPPLTVKQQQALKARSIASFFHPPLIWEIRHV